MFVTCVKGRIHVGFKVRSHGATNRRDMSLGQISSCVIGLNLVAGTKNCPRDMLHEIKLI